MVGGSHIAIESYVSIRPDVDLFAAEKIVIGEGSDIGTRNRITGNVIIEKECLFGPDNYISSMDHNYEDITQSVLKQGVSAVCKNGHHEIVIGEGSWIGTHVAIIGDVHIGKHCVIGANSVVTKDIPPYSIAVGIPAKVIKKYNSEKKIWEQLPSFPCNSMEDNKEVTE